MDARTVSHAMGETDVPADPQRVVVLDTVLLDASVALGVVPVGAALVEGTEGLPAYLGPDVAEVQPVGTIMEPSLESIGALEPDLILSAKSRHEDLYDELSGIGPTVFVEAPGGDWRGSVAIVGEALGQADQSRAVLEEYDERAKALRTEVEPQSLTAQVIRPRDGGAIRLYGPGTFTGDVLTDAGLTIPDQDWEDNGILEVSTEFSGALATDVVFVSGGEAEPELPAWVTESLDTGGSRIIEVDHASWIAGVGPLGAEAILTELEEHLGG